MKETKKDIKENHIHELHITFVTDMSYQCDYYRGYPFFLPLSLHSQFYFYLYIYLYSDLLIRTHAKLFLGDQDSFHVNHIYKDDDTYSVVAAAAEILGKVDYTHKDREREREHVIVSGRLSHFV